LAQAFGNVGINGRIKNEAALLDEPPMGCYSATLGRRGEPVKTLETNTGAALEVVGR
jgi:hypothetical protein